jgi:putative ABC transport system ATP-binding protein
MTYADVNRLTTANGATNSMYSLTEVAKTYRKNGQRIDAVRDLDIRIERGEWLAIQGHTGSGKTTLLQLLGGLDRPTSGQLSLDGRELTALGEAEMTEVRAKSIGFIFQTFNLIPTLTARENVEAALIPLGVDSRERRKRAADALAELGLHERANHLPAELSGGQQQRVAIARAIVKAPLVLLADEPTGNLDERTRDAIIAQLEELWRDHGLTFVLVTHDPAAAARAQRVAQMQNGSLISLN